MTTEKECPDLLIGFDGRIPDGNVSVRSSMAWIYIKPYLDKMFKTKEHEKIVELRVSEEGIEAFFERINK